MRLANIQLTLIFLLSWTYVTAQKRIGVDVSTRLDNLTLTVHYQEVLKNRWLYSLGLYYGTNGRVFVLHDPVQLSSTSTIKSPYTNANRMVVDSVNSYTLLDYRSSAKSMGIQFGIGYFYEFGVEHGIRVNLNSKIGYAETELYGIYTAMNSTEVVQTHMNYHVIGALSLEVFHTIRISGRTTFNYGVKIPYFYTVDKARFNPTRHKDLLYGFEPELSIGLTRVIGKCD